MLRDFLVFCLCFVAIRASGEFSVLSCPKSISFKGDDVLQSEFAGDVILAGMAKPVADGVTWTGMIINSPFNLAKAAIAVLVDGVSHISLSSTAKTYPLKGSYIDESLNAVSAQLEADNESVCDINFNQFDEAALAYSSCFGDVAISDVEETKYLNPTQHSEDKQLLQSLSYIEAATKNLSDMKKSSNVLILRLSLSPIAKVHGEMSDAMAEASKLVSEAISKLNTAARTSSDKQALVVVVANKYDSKRIKREEPEEEKKNEYNLAEHYSENYPVIFNIILWFMVTFGLSLLAICYAIGSMDPGRDSIIYRMTSTRMKKDN